MERIKFSDLENMMKETPQPADETTIKEVEKIDAPPVEEAPPAEPGAQSAPPVEPDSMNLGDFAIMATKIYCKLSDTVYKRIKKEDPPAWDGDTKEMITEAAQKVLRGYNVPTTPIWQLITCVAVAEIVRYTGR